MGPTTKRLLSGEPTGRVESAITAPPQPITFSSTVPLQTVIYSCVLFGLSAASFCATMIEGYAYGKASQHLTRNLRTEFMRSLMKQARSAHSCSATERELEHAFEF